MYQFQCPPMRMDYLTCSRVNQIVSSCIARNDSTINGGPCMLALTERYNFDTRSIACTGCKEIKRSGLSIYTEEQKVVVL